MDIESLERDNDRQLDELGDKVNLLQSMTRGVRTEVREHHRTLDSLGLHVGSADGMLSSTVGRMKKVMANRQSRRTVTLVTTALCLIVFLYWLFKT